MNKRQVERAEKREAKAKAKAAKKAGEPIDEWVPVEGPFFGVASDGRGHHDGECQYHVAVPKVDFGRRFFPSGEARWTRVNGGDPNKIYKLPPVAPRNEEAIVFKIPVHPAATGGRVMLVDGLVVRPARAAPAQA